MFHPDTVDGRNLTPEKSRQTRSKFGTNRGRPVFNEKLVVVGGVRFFRRQREGRARLGVFVFFLIQSWVTSGVTRKSVGERLIDGSVGPRGSRAVFAVAARFKRLTTGSDRLAAAVLRLSDTR